MIKRVGLVEWAYGRFYTDRCRYVRLNRIQEVTEMNELDSDISIPNIFKTERITIETDRYRKDVLDIIALN